MPVRHSFHHGISFVLAIIVSIVLGETCRKYLPRFFDSVDETAALLISRFSLDAQVDTVSIVILACLVAMAYGFIFGVLEKSKS